MELGCILALVFLCAACAVAFGMALYHPIRDACWPPVALPVLPPTRPPSPASRSRSSSRSVPSQSFVHDEVV